MENEKKEISRPALKHPLFECPFGGSVKALDFSEDLGLNQNSHSIYKMLNQKCCSLVEKPSNKNKVKRYEDNSSIKGL